MFIDYFDDEQIREALEEANYYLLSVLDTGFSLREEYILAQKRCKYYYENGLYDDYELLVSEFVKRELGSKIMDLLFV